MIGKLTTSFFSLFFILITSSFAGDLDNKPDTATSPWLLQYLYINANEDQASGGHTALRINNEIYHFQFEDGLLKMTRDNWYDFQVSYRGFQNRSIFASQMSVTYEAFEKISHTFHAHYLNQQRQLKILADTKADAALLQKLILKETIKVPALGFYANNAEPHILPLPDEHIFQQLKHRSQDLYGEDFIQQKRLEVQRQISELSVQALQVTATDFEFSRRYLSSYSFHARYHDLINLDAALAMLESPRAVAPERLISVELAGETYRLDEKDLQKITQAIEDLSQSLLSQLNHSHSSWGHSFLLNLARLGSLQYSLDNLHWASLNTQGENALHVNISPQFRDHLPKTQELTLASWQKIKQSWQESLSWNEADFLRLESLSNHLHALETAMDGASDIYLPYSHRIPVMSADIVPVLIPMAIGNIATEQSQRLQRQFNQSYADSLQFSGDAMAYSLLSNNCVTALFELLHTAFLDDDSQASDQLQLIEEALGGFIAPKPVPFLSAQQVVEHWNISENIIYPSSRLALLQQKNHEEASLWQSLRESTTLGSTVYFPDESDSIFLFFTDDVIWSRPIAGAFNLITGAGAAIGGILALPFDQGKTFNRGLKGMLFSLPELAFFNIRKGSNCWIPEETYELLD